MKRQSKENDNVKKRKKVKKYLSEKKLKEISSIFLSDKRNANILLDLLNQFHKPSETPVPCMSAVENVFVEVLKRRDMTVDNTENTSDAEYQYKEWLRGCYEDAWIKLRSCLQRGTPECQLKALNSLFTLLSIEAKFPLVTKKKKNKLSFPVKRLTEILHSLSLSKDLNKDVLVRMSQITEYKDVNSNLWLASARLLENLCKHQPNDNSIWNLLHVLTRLPKHNDCTDILLCNIKNGVPDDRAISMAVDSVWKQLAPWQYSAATHQLLLVVLIEHMMPHMNNAVFLTDYFMDVLQSDGCEISMLALQGIFNLILKYNIEYPDIFGKLYQLFTKDILNAKYKTRLYALADEFLRSTHLPLTLVAAFVKRFSRLLLKATPPDQLILMTFIANLLIRHPDLRFLINKPNSKEVKEDLYLEDEKDPIKSNASESQLWELKLMQHHYIDRVAKMATTIMNDLPSVEYQLEPLLELTWGEMIEKDFKRLIRKVPHIVKNLEDNPLPRNIQNDRQKEIDLIFLRMKSVFDLPTD